MSPTFDNWQIMTDVAVYGHGCEHMQHATGQEGQRVPIMPLALLIIDRAGKGHAICMKCIQEATERAEQEAEKVM